MLGFQGPSIPNWLFDFEKKFGLGGVILFDYSCQTKTYKNNVESKVQLKTLCSEITKMPSRPLIFVDQEGGKVRRLKEGLGFAALPSQAELAKKSESERRQILEKSFLEMRELGISYDLTPVIDLNLNPKNPNIGAIERSYSDSPDVVRENVAIVNSVAKSARLGLCLKHYPGLGGAKVDSHLELTDITNTYDSQEEELFFELAPHLSGNAILLCHGIMKHWDSDLPISLSPAAVNRLRRRLPDTLLMTDDLQMEGLLRHRSIADAALLSLKAGVDMVLIGNNLLGEEKGIFEIANNVALEAEKNRAFADSVNASQKRIQIRKELFA